LSIWGKITRTISIVPITFLFSLYLLISDKQDISIGSMLTHRILGQVGGESSKAFVLVLSNLLYLVLFNIFFGNIISEEFRFSSVYLFSRLKNRKVWFYKKASEMLMIASIYTLLFLGSNIFICMFCSIRKIEINDIKVFLVLFGLITMILAITTTLINLVSIRLGSTTAFITVYICVVILVFISLEHENIPFLGKYYYTRVFNPLSGVALNLSENLIAQCIILVYYLVLITLTFILGGNYINGIDIALIDCESV